MMTAEAIRGREMAEMSRPAGGRPRNVGHAERLASEIGGGLLVGLGLLKGGVGGLTLAGLGGAFLYRGTTGHCHLYQAIGANTADERGEADSVPAGAGVRVDESITIGRSPDDLYRFWRDYANLPRFMTDIRSVTATSPDGTKSHWVAQGPGGAVLEWDSELVTDTPARSSPGGPSTARSSPPAPSTSAPPPAGEGPRSA